MTRQLTEDALQAAGIAVRRTLEIGSRESIRQAILCGLGISLIPSREIPSHPDLAALDIQGADIEMHEYLYCLRERQPVQLIARFLEMAPAAD
jgi:DNA-binding transcriptional LysR family regulator